MAGNSFGQIFRITTFGESHGGGVGVVVDGCPAGLEIHEEEIQKELDRRKPGQSSITTPRKEEDKIHILSGTVDGKTTGTPILLIAYNKNANPKDYEDLRNLYRPGHADYTYEKKYGIRTWQGSGRSSARETLGRVAAGAIAEKYLKQKLNVEFLSFVEQVGNIRTDINFNIVNRDMVEASLVRCPDLNVSEKMIELIEKVRDEGDSIGGIIKAVVRNVPVGLGEPVFDKLPADLAKAMMSINAVKGFEIGQGFSGVVLRGSEYNDEFYADKKGKVRTKTNNAGGTLGGISNGEDIYFRLAFKPVSTIKIRQNTLDINNSKVDFQAKGRHDPCVLPRAVPIVDAMTAIVIMDHYLRQISQNS